MGDRIRHANGQIVRVAVTLPTVFSWQGNETTNLDQQVPNVA